MTPAEIKIKIDENNAKIESFAKKGLFIFNKDMAKYILENKQLREECPHEFVDGVCKYCYKGLH